MKKLIVFIIATLLTFGVGVLSAPSASANVEAEKVFPNGTIRFDRSHWVKERELRYVELMPKGHAYVEFNDGSSWLFAPCVYEDSGRCYWDAGHRGNKVGTSFIRFKGKTFRL